jgi:curli production assembly/transport component CsgG
MLVGILFLAGCTVPQSVQEAMDSEPEVQINPMQAELRALPGPDGEPVPIGVYSFTDKTGQRKPADSVANLSSAVTQGAEVWLIDALLEAGEGEWFNVVERVSLDNYDDPSPLEPMLFAGVVLEGGIIGYDSNQTTGGYGARYFGIGAATEYRVDTVTVGMRLVSVGTGRVLMSVAAEKTIASHRSGADVFKFLDMSTKALEIESGYSVNEPTNYAVRAAIEAGVIELIYEGNRKGFWSFKQ